MSTNGWAECFGDLVAWGSFWENIALENVNLRGELVSLKEEYNKTLESYHQLLKESNGMAEARAKESKEKDGWKQLHDQIIDEYLKLFKDYTNRGDRIKELLKELKEVKEKPEDSIEKDIWKERHAQLLDSYNRLLDSYNIRGTRITELEKEKYYLTDEEVKLFMRRLYDCFIGSTKNDTGLDCIASYMALSSFTDAFSNLYTLIDDEVSDEHFYDVIYDFLEWARKDYYNNMVEKVSNKEESANKEAKYENYTTEV